MKALRDWSLRSKGLLVVAIPLVALIAVSGTFSTLFDTQRRRQTSVERTLEVRRQIQLVLTLIVDAETGARGYAVSARPEFLEPLETAARQLPGELDRLQQLVSDEPLQVSRVRRLRSTGRRRLEVLGSIQDVVERFGIDRERIEPLLLEGKPLMDGVRRTMSDMQETEQRQQEVDERASARAERNLRLVLWAGLGIGLVGGLVATALFFSSIRARVRRLNRNADLLAEGKPLEALPPGQDEIGQLGRRMQAASDLLRSRAEELAIAEADLRHGLSLLRATLAATTEGVAALDASGRLVLHNPQFLEMWGYDRSGLPEVDQNALFAELIAKLKDPEATMAALVCMVEGPEAGGNRLVELEDGRVFEVRFNPQRLEGAVVGRVWSVRDVTAAHRHREHLERARAEAVAAREDAEEAMVEAETAKEEADRAREEADAANNAKSEFLSRMSHELRTPLNAILGFGQLLELDAKEPRVREAVGQILRGGKHLLDLINEVLDIARIESGRMSLSVEELLISEVVTEVLDLMGPMASRAGIRLDGVQAVLGPWRGLADRQRLKQVLLNLVSNGVKYNRPGGTVRVSVAASGRGTVRIDVADEGTGLLPGQVDRLFIPFDRVGAEHTEIEGTGLGLALSKRLVEAMGGRIGVESRPGEGSTFWVELTEVAAPLSVRLDGDAPGPLRLANIPEELRAHASRERERLGTDKVLYVEDNLSNLRLIEQLLARRPAVELITAMQGRLGLELARYHCPRLILLDLHLPDMHGAEVLRALRNDPTTSSIPVVVLSADATPGQVDRIMAAGAVEYIAKPLDLQRLLHVLDGTLASGPVGS